MTETLKPWTPNQIAAILIYLAAKKLVQDAGEKDGYDSLYTDLHWKETKGAQIAIDNMKNVGITSEDVTDIIANWRKFYDVLIARKRRM